MFSALYVGRSGLKSISRAEMVYMVYIRKMRDWNLRYVFVSSYIFIFFYIYFIYFVFLYIISVV